MRMGYAREDDVRDPGVDQVKVSEVLDGHGLESQVP